MAVPSQFLFMLEELRERRAELGRIRLWVYGSAPMPGEVSRALAETFPGTGQQQLYGMTETGVTGTTVAPEFTFSKLTSCGRPMPLCDAKIVDEAGRTLGPDEIGEICLTQSLRQALIASRCSPAATAHFRKRRSVEMLQLSNIF